MNQGILFTSTPNADHIYAWLSDIAKETVYQTLVAGGKQERGHGVRFAPERTQEHLQHAQEHLAAHLRGEGRDSDTDLLHLAHALTRTLLAMVNPAICELQGVDKPKPE